MKLFFKIFFANIIFFVFSFSSFADSEKQKHNDILDYGLDSEISELLDTLVKEKITDYDEKIKKLFTETKNITIREKIIFYYIETENPELKEFAVSVLEDPFDTKLSTVNLIFDYVKKIKLKEAIIPIKKLLDNENEEYIIKSLETLGEIGEKDEATFLAEYLERPISVAQKQVLVKSLGKIKAVETWDKLAEIVQNDDENKFMRMYAAEAIGSMEKEESIPILTKLFESPDPNLRIYAIKGLSNFNTQESQDTILQGFRDSYVNVRSEAALASEKQKLQASIPYLLYRAKSDPELSVKKTCYESLTAFPTDEVIDFFREVFKNDKASDVLRIAAAKSLIKIDFSDSYSIIEEWLLNSLKDEKTKKIRYEFTKLLVDQESSALKNYCMQCLESKDVLMQHFGVDIYLKNKFLGVDSKIKEFASNDKNASLQKKAKKALGLPDDWKPTTDEIKNEKESS